MPEFLVDPSFETVFDFGTPWRKGIGSGCSIDATFRAQNFLNPGSVRTGNRAVGYLLSSSGGQSRCGYVECDIPFLTEGLNYKASVWIKTQSWIAAMKLKLIVNGVVLGTFSQASESAHVQLGPFTFTAAASPVLRFESPSDGEDAANRYFFIDDASVTEIVDPNPQPIPSTFRMSRADRGQISA